jgi:hypothetical protein
VPLSLVPLSLTYSPNPSSHFPWYTLLSQYFIGPALGYSVVGFHYLQTDSGSPADTPETYQPRTSLSPPTPHRPYLDNYFEMLSLLVRSMCVKVWYVVERSVMSLYLLQFSWSPFLDMCVERMSHPAFIISAGTLFTPGDLPHFCSLITSVTSSWLRGFSFPKCVPVGAVHCPVSLPPLLRMCFPSTQIFSGHTHYLLISISYQARFGRITFLSESCPLQTYHMVNCTV